MTLAKPPQAENDEFKSAKWDELTSERGFEQSDAPALALLCIPAGHIFRARKSWLKN